MAEAELPQWMLQVSPADLPGSIGRLFGKKASAGPAEVLEMANAIDRILKGPGNFAEIRWCWDGFPEEGNSTPEPTMWSNL
jgi:hypothetical protein